MQAATQPSSQTSLLQPYLRTSQQQASPIPSSRPGVQWATFTVHWPGLLNFRTEQVQHPSKPITATTPGAGLTRPTSSTTPPPVRNGLQSLGTMTPMETPLSWLTLGATTPTTRTQENTRTRT